MKRSVNIKRIYVFYLEVERRMIKKERFFVIFTCLFFLIISPLTVHAAHEEMPPVKTGEYHCVSYPGIGTRVLTLFREPDGTVYFSLEGAHNKLFEPDPKAGTQTLDL